MDRKRSLYFGFPNDVPADLCRHSVPCALRCPIQNLCCQCFAPSDEKSSILQLPSIDRAAAQMRLADKSWAPLLFGVTSPLDCKKSSPSVAFTRVIDGEH